MAWHAAYQSDPVALRDFLSCADDWKVAAVRHVPLRRWWDMFSCPTSSVGSKRLGPVSSDCTPDECVAALERYLLHIKKPADFAAAAAREIADVLAYPVNRLLPIEPEHRALVHTASERKRHLLRMALAHDTYRQSLDDRLLWTQGWKYNTMSDSSHRRSRRLAGGEGSNLTSAAYLAQMKALGENCLWGVMEIDHVVKYERDMEHFLFGACYFWGFGNQTEAAVFASLGTAVYQAHAGKKPLRRELVAFTLPPCQVVVGKKKWYVPANFPIQFQDERLAELLTLFDEYYVPRSKKRGVSAESLKDDHDVFYGLANMIKETAQTLPRAMWSERGDGFLSDDPTKVVEEDEDEDDDSSMPDADDDEDGDDDEPEDGEASSSSSDEDDSSSDDSDDDDGSDDEEEEEDDDDMDMSD